MHLRRLIAAVASVTAALSTVVAINGTSAAVTTCDRYVSPGGSDSSAGTLSAPWKTLQKARDTIRANGLNVGMSDDLTVCLRGGRYPLASTFGLTEADSGSNGHDVVYAAYPGETPILDGGKQVTGWTQVAGKSYWTANVPTTAGYSAYFRQLYVDGVRARLASGKAIAGSSFYDDPGTPQSTDGIVFPAASWPSYTHPTDVRLFHVGCGFKADYFPVVKATVDATTAKIQLAQPSMQARVDRGSACFNYNQTFYVQNALEELDSAGEWYLDQTTHKIYYQPLAGQSMASAIAYVPTIDQLVTVTGSSGTQKAHDIAFEGLTFEHSNWAFPRTGFIGGSQAEAIYGPGQSTYTDEVPGDLWLTNTDGIRFVNNTIRRSGSGGLHLRTGATNTTVTGNQFYDLTAAGIIAGRWRDLGVAADQRTKNATITNNVVHDTGADFMQATGISLMNTYNVNVSHNLVYRTAYSGIHQRMAEESGLYAGPDGIGNTTIAYNRVFDAGNKKMWGMWDNGSIYSFGSVPGTSIHHNYVSKVTTTRAYMSDNMSYQTRWDDNVADGGPFSAYMPGRAPKSVYAARNYTTTDANTSYANFIFDVDGPPHVKAATDPWPAAAQSIIAGAGLQSAFSGLRWAGPSSNLADYSTVGASGSWSTSDLAKAWDGQVESGELGATTSVAWVEYDLGKGHQGFTFRFQNDNNGTYRATAWKVQRWSDSQAAWVDVMPYQSANTAAQLSYKPTADLATSKIRLYVQNTDPNGKAGFSEFGVTATPKM